MSRQDSDSDSSDSSNEFMVSPEKLKSISPFFVKAKPKNVQQANAANETTDESDIDENIETPVEGSDLMVQVLKNLEATKQAENIAKEFNDGEKCGKISSPKKELTNEIADLLLMGEKGATASTSAGDNDDEPDDEPAEVSAPSDYAIPKEGVKITLVDSSLIFNQRKKKKQESLEDLLKKKLNQQLRSNQVLIHKVGLLCWLARGFYINKQINNPILLAAALKLAPKNCYPKGRVDLSYLEKITKWFHGVFAFVTGKPEQAITTLNLLRRLKDKEVYNYWEKVLLYIATLRALGLNCRLVVSLQPPSLKVSRDQLIDTEPLKENKNAATGKMKPKKEAEEENEKGGKDLKKKIVNKAKSSVKQEKSPIKQEKSPVKEELPEKSNISTRLRRATEARKRAAEILKRKRDGNVSSEDEKPATKKLALRSGKKIAEPAVIKKEKGAAVEKKGEGEAGKKVGRTLRSGKKTVEKKKVKEEEDDKDDEFIVDEEEDEEEEDDDEDEDFEKKTPKSKRKEVISKPFSRTRNKKMGSKTGAEAKKPAKATARRSSSARKLVSSDEDSEEDEEKPKKVKQGKDIWAEVYVESEENWISVSVNDGKIHCTADLYKNATDPVLYVMAWNSEGNVRDVTRRYCPHWLTVTRKQRIDEKWWLEAHTPWKEPVTALTKAEDEIFQQKELEQPLPKTVSECKGHPLYVLQRHLLKFEALYPEDVVPLGYVRGEAIYSRHCVHTLMSRETWVKSARVVRPGEKCYKVVKARPKFDKLSGARLQDESLEVFGKWQTDPYVPPEAKNGVVPRNEYGNVDLFKDCMLPKGTVHIKLPALNRVARKLDIDCVPAVVGFNFGGGRPVPAFEGFIVCEEFEDVLREAWETEQVEADKRAREKYEKRVYGNWRKLIKAALIRERLTAKYDFNNEEDKSSTSNKQTKKRTKQTKDNGKKVKVDKKR